MVLNSGTDEECPVCLDSLVCPVITHCVHVFCRRCIEDVIKLVDGQSRCPLCRATIAMNQLVEVPPEKDTDQVDNNDWFSSAKVMITNISYRGLWRKKMSLREIGLTLSMNE